MARLDSLLLFLGDMAKLILAMCKERILECAAHSL